MKFFAISFFILFISFSVHSWELSLNGLSLFGKGDDNKKIQSVKNDIDDSKVLLYGSVVEVFPLEGEGDLRLLWDKIESAIGLVAVSGFGKNALGTGFFISDKLFFTDFLTVDQLRRDGNSKIAIWIKDQYFSVKKAKFLHGARNIAVLEIESSYKGGVLKLGEETVAPAAYGYGVGFDVRETALSDSKYYITAEEILSGLEEKRNSRVSSDKYVNIIQIIDHQNVSDYQLFHLNRVSTHSSTNGLPFVNRRGEVIGMKFGSLANLAYVTPVKFLKEVLEGEENCGQMSIHKCLDHAIETLYEQARNQDPVAQYVAYNSRLYASNLSEVLHNKMTEAVRWLLSSAEAGNVLSQLKSVVYITYDYQCFAFPNKNGNRFLYADYLLRSFNKILSDKKEVVQRSLKWLNQMEKKTTAAYYLKGLMYLNGKCIEKDFEKGLSYLEKAGVKGFSPALNILIDNYSLKGGRSFDFLKAQNFLQIFYDYDIKHYDPFFNVTNIDKELIIQ